jgi:hypothetical protein
MISSTSTMSTSGVTLIGDLLVAFHWAPEFASRGT